MSFLHHMMPILQHMMLVPCHMMLILHHMIFLCHMIIPFLHHMKLFLHHMMPFLYHRFWFWNTVVSSNCTLTPPRAYRAVPLERSYGNKTTFMEDLNKICSKIATVGRKHLLPFPSPRTCWAWQYQLSSAPRSSASSDHMCAGGGPGRVWWWEEWEMWKCEGRGRVQVWGCGNENREEGRDHYTKQPENQLTLHHRWHQDINHKIDSQHTGSWHTLVPRSSTLPGNEAWANK